MDEQVTGIVLVSWIWILMGGVNLLTLIYYFGHPDANDCHGHCVWYYNLLLNTNGFITAFWLILFECLHGLAIISHAMAVLADPGTLRKYGCPTEVPEGAEESVCEKCDKQWKPPRAHHCNRCGCCIFRMDHHCFWIRNCIGQANQKYFILFLLYVVLGSALDVALFLTLLVRCWWFRTCMRRYIVVGLIVIGACYILGRIAKTYLFEMIEAVVTNSTLVESYQGTRGKKGTVLNNFKEVFGNAVWLWWLPVPPKITLDFYERVEREKGD